MQERIQSDTFGLMTKVYKFRTFEEDIQLLQNEIKSAPSISIAQILDILSGKGRPLILMLLALPFCQPIQIPGLSTPFGLIIAFMGLRMALGKGMWLPARLLQKTIATPTLQKITDNVLAVVKRIKPWVHPRLNWMCHSQVMEKVNGLMIFFLGILLALPLPIPLSNLTAAWSIFFIALGILEDDGVFVLGGYFISLLTMLFFIIIAMQLKSFF